MPMISVRMPDEMTAKLEQRGEKAHTVRESLERYFALLDRARVSQREMFTADERGLIADSCNGELFEAWSIPHIAEGVQDSIFLDKLDEKWHVDGDALIDKIRTLSLAEKFALVDAVERFWHAPPQGDTVNYADLLA